MFTANHETTNNSTTSTPVKTIKTRPNQAVASPKPADIKAVDIDQFRPIFDKYDLDKDGKISTAELKQVFAELCPEYTEEELVKNVQSMLELCESDESISFKNFVTQFGIKNSRRDTDDYDADIALNQTFVKKERLVDEMKDDDEVHL